MHHQGDVIAFWKLAVTVRCEAITYDACGTTYKACKCKNVFRFELI